MTADRWPEVERLFHATLDRRPDERAAFLDAACAGDDDLRREVASLLDEEAEKFLESPALQDAALELAGEGVQSPPDPQITGYTILKTLGEGGMGVVYLAEQLAPIRRQVALKLIKHGMDTRLVIARFDVERQALALMHHPHIAAVFDAGTTADGRPFFVMEYVDGVPITEYCDRHRLSTRARLELFTDVCGAVQHAHQKGVIHRDLKPSNVLVSEQDGRPLPKIIDFGVAKAIEPSLTGRTAFTEQGTMVGTPEYMSPEQAALSHDIDTTTDVYSLGVLLYELLVGALPFDPKMLRAAGYDEMRRVIRESDPPKPSSRLTGTGLTAEAAALARQTDAGRLTRHLRGDLDWITLKALEKDRRQRYATVAAFATDIGHFLANEPIDARPPSAVYRMRKFTRRYRGPVLAAAAIFLALVAGLAASITQYVRAEGQRVEADRQRAHAEVQRTAAEASARDASVQRNAAVLATDDANRQRMVATRAAAAAAAARHEAEYRAYVATIVAADGELRASFANEARQRLLAIPATQRGWEWEHLFLRTDTSLATLASRAPCVDPAWNLSVPVLTGNYVFRLAASGRVYLGRCGTFEVWDGPSHAYVVHQMPERILAIGPTGVAVAVAQVGYGSASQWHLRLIEPATGRSSQRFGPLPAEPICADTNSDGTRLAVGFRPQYSPIGEPLEDFFDLWDVQAARRLLRLSPKKPPLFDTRDRFPTSCSVAFSPDSLQLASSGAMVHVWRSESGAQVAADAIQAGSISQPIAWSGDGAHLAIGRRTGLVDILTLMPLQQLDHLDGLGLVRVLPMPDGDRRVLVRGRKKNEVQSVAFSRDGTWVATGTELSVSVWNVSAKKLTKVLVGHSARIIGVALDAAGNIISADGGGVVKVWQAASSVHDGVTVLPGMASTAGEFVLSANGAVVGVAQTDGGLYAWRLSERRRTNLRIGIGQVDTLRLARSLAISPDGRQLLAAEYDAVGTVRSWAVDSGSSTAHPTDSNRAAGCEQVSSNRAYGVTRMAVSPDGHSLALEHGRCLVVRDILTMAVLATLHEYPTSFTFRPDGSLLLTAYSRGLEGTGPRGRVRAMIWDWRSNKVLAEVIAPTAPDQGTSTSWRATMSADGRRIALVGGSLGLGIASIWDGELRRELGRLPMSADTEAIALSPDGSRLASTGADTAVRIWDVTRLQLLLLLSDDDQHSAGIAFTPDGRLIAGRSSGGLTIWETKKK